MVLLQRISGLIVFSCVAAAALVLFPFYWRWALKRGYSKQVDEHYKNALGAEESLELDGTVLRSTGKGMKSEIELTEIEGIAVIPTHYFVFLKAGGAYIYPKDEIDRGQLTGFVDFLSEQSGKPITKPLNFKM
ncbi:MAG: YcxB family protein [Spirochaetales bacterium]|nr:YcxB family protein [Spirochaetales bacterium]